LSSKPDDRRMVFEEAAGITKFKAQKKEALRKLEATDQNLLRVEDLIKEVKRQIGSLQRQAGKARRYKQILTELQHLDTQLARHQFDVLQGEIRDRETAVEKMRVEIELCSEGVHRGENEISQLRERLSELEQEISTAQQLGLELKGQIERHESRIHFNQERLKEFESQNSKAVSDISQAEERRLIAEQELTTVIDNLAASEQALAEKRKDLEAKRDALQTVERELITKQEAIRKAQSDLFGAAQQLSRVRNEINTLDLQKQGNVVRLEKLAAEKIQLEEERARLEMRLQEFAANVEMEKLNVQTQRGTVEQRQARLREIQQELTRVNQELDQQLRLQAEKRSRLNVLEQLQDSHEGFSAGALAALKTAQNALGSLADKIKVPDQYIVAIETALGHNLQLVLTQQPESAQTILDDLRNNKKGRASIAALALQSLDFSLKDFNVPNATTAVSVVEADPAVQPLLQRLLGQTLIVPDLAAATAAWRETNGSCDFVTQTGELLNRNGVYTGGYLNGAGNGKAPSSILGRKNQIAELQTVIAQLQEQVNEISRSKGALLSEQTELQASLQQAQTELRTQEVAIATRQGEFNALQNSQRVLQQKVASVENELDRLTAQEQEGLQKREALATQIGELELRERELQSHVAGLNTGVEELRQHRDVANATLTETKVSLATEEQLCASYRSQKNPLEQRIRELTHIAEQRRNEIATFLTRKTQAESEIAESEQKIESLKHEREQINQQTVELISQKDEQESNISMREEALRDQRRRLTETQQQRGTVEVELAQKNMSVQNLRERVQQKYQINIDDVRSECFTITYADEGAAKVETITPEEMEKSGMATDWNVVAEQVAALQKRIDEIGPVNLVAIEEYEETEQRYQFLTKQNEDLVTAKAQLMDVINRINTQTKEMFVETFNKIRDNFRTMFVDIFGGGKADLVLVNDGDVLESGIEIMARPPGKQLQTISLLSGGEQTMTAVALLFSIYQVKPSPFCVLDELDAPLDESNVNRFIKVVKRFIEASQFVIITHNKRTIGMADVLYGVTMQEHGVSKIVSVRFHKADEQVTDRVPQPLHGTATATAPATEAPPAAAGESSEIVMAK
jgi:chromosome segregation protein